ncbi:hypothetical protein GKE82_26100 [Conexibacter sp. W3-3-2]|uniref:hypothetical protein n=1 Tax=Conexibacter sp. W3-3-2 TaxID=2675227 RepID=UPI0012B7BEFB|nr:hypothetical protein [Conexibacter sp. W3-3-2]MTD47678.1 hypothetical protein [Conexibacter sp. W3-3-2]
MVRQSAQERYVSLLTSLVDRHESVERIVAGRWPTWAHLAEDATARAYEELLTLPANREAIERLAASERREPTAEDVLKHWKLKAFSRLQNEVRAVQGEDRSMGPRSYVEYDPAVHDREAPEDRAGADEGLERESVLRELLLRLPAELKPLARLRLVEMQGLDGDALSKGQALERLGWSPKQWKTRSAKLTRLLQTEIERKVDGAWCAEHRDRMAELVVKSVLATDDALTSAHLDYCEACNEHVAFLARELERSAAAVLPPVPALASAGLLGSIAAKVGGWFSSGEGAATTVGGGAAGGGLLASSGTAVKVCVGLVGCAAVAAPIAVTVKADPEPPAEAKSAPATPRTSARPIATVAPVVATPSAAQVRAQERARRSAVSKAKRAARREKRSSADAAFKVSSAARSARSAAPTQSDKALGLSSGAPAAPARSAPASAGSGGGGGGGASDAPTSADKAFGLSTGGG